MSSHDQAHADLPQTPERGQRYWQLLALLQATLFAAIVAFLALPGIDIAASSVFAAQDGSFPLEADPVAVALRDFFRVFFWVIVGSVLIMLGASLAAGARAQVPWRVWAFAASALALGPGLLVNWLLKGHVGRPRPFDVTAFGGDHAFVMPFILSDACSRNCSFVSGEGAAMATLFLLAVALAWRPGGSLLRHAIILSLAGPALLAGGLRVAMGRHFLSDIVFAWLLCALVVMLLYALFRVAPVRHRVTAAGMLGDVAVAVGRLSPGRGRRAVPGE